MKSAQILPLTSLRGFAAWWVAIFHFRDYLPGSLHGLDYLWSKGYLAVDLFFVLSGFVLQLNYFKDGAIITKSVIYEFAIARIARVYPLHVLVLLIYISVPVSIILFSSKGDTGNYTVFYFFASLSLTHGFGFLNDFAFWNAPSWSLSTELAAYMILPLWIYATARVPVWKRIVQPIMPFLLVLLLIGIFSALGADSIATNISHFGIIRCLCEFFLGISLCQLYLRNGELSNTQYRLVFLLASCFAFLYILDVFPDYVTAPGFFACVVFGCTARNTLINTALSRRSLVYLGQISFATYMVHYFVMTWTIFLLVRDGIPNYIIFGTFIALTFIASAGLYRWVELPAQKVIRRFGSRQIHPSSAANPVALLGRESVP